MHSKTDFYGYRNDNIEIKKCRFFGFLLRASFVDTHENRLNAARLVNIKKNMFRAK